MNILTIIFICFFAINILRGYLRGFAMCVVDLCSLGFSIIGGIVLSPILAKFLTSTPEYINLKNYFSSIVNFNSILTSNSAADKTINLENLGLPSKLTDFALSNNNPEIYKLLNVHTLEDYIVSILMSVIVNISSFMIIMLIIYIIVFFIKLSLIPLLSLPVIGTFDKLSGAILGVVKALLFTWLIMLLLPIFFGKADYASIYAMITSSPFLNFIYSHNLIFSYFLSGSIFK